MAKKEEAGTHFSKDQLGATDATALDAVSSVGADEQADLVDAWVKAGNVAAVARVAREDDAPAPARKAARRGLNVLKSRGMKIPEHTTVARPFAEKIERTLEARLVPPDGSGNETVMILARAPGKDTRLAEVLIADGVGIVRASGGSVSSSRLREWENDTRRTRGLSPFGVTVEWARWKIASAKLVNAKSGVPIPLELDSFSDLLEPAPSSAPDHPVKALGLDTESTDEIRVARSAQLHARPEFRAYMPTRAALQELLVKIGERVATLGGNPAPEAFAPVMREEIAAATDRFFVPEVREIIAQRMLDAAPAVFADAGKELALDVLATRVAIQKAGLITQPPRDIPFLRAFFDKAVAVLAQQGGGQLQIPIPAPQQGAGGPVLSADQLAAIEAARVEAPAEKLARSKRIEPARGRRGRAPSFSGAITGGRSRRRRRACRRRRA